MPALVRSRLRRTPILLSVVTTLIQRMLSMAGESHAVLSVEFVGDRRMKRLNARYRGRDVTTDVLAFAIREGPGPRSALLGYGAFSVPRACRQAAEHGHSIQHELTVLLIHGLLHLLGYDHEQGDGEARRMRRKERAMLQALMPVPAMIKQDALSRSRRRLGAR